MPDARPQEPASRAGHLRNGAGAGRRGRPKWQRDESTAQGPPYLRCVASSAGLGAWRRPDGVGPTEEGEGPPERPHPTVLERAGLRPGARPVGGRPGRRRPAGQGGAGGRDRERHQEAGAVVCTSSGRAPCPPRRRRRHRRDRNRHRPALRLYLTRAGPPGRGQVSAEIATNSRRQNRVETHYAHLTGLLAARDEVRRRRRQLPRRASSCSGCCGSCPIELATRRSQQTVPGQRGWRWGSRSCLTGRWRRGRAGGRTMARPRFPACGRSSPRLAFVCCCCCCCCAVAWLLVAVGGGCW